MTHKTNYFHILHNQIVFIKSHFNCNVKFVRTDNAKEICEGYMTYLYHKFGITYQISCVETS